jgi:hypothetical protein
MPEQQVYSFGEVKFGNIVKLFWVPAFPGDGGTVPPNHVLDITSICLNFFPEGAATVGRVNIGGRDGPGVGSGSVVWALQVVYVDPKTTLHLTFPSPLRLKAGGHVELAFLDDGPGTIIFDVNGMLVGR